MQKRVNFYSLNKINPRQKIVKNPEFSCEEVGIWAGQKITLKVKYSFMGFCVPLCTDCQWQLRTVNGDERIESSGLNN